MVASRFLVVFLMVFPAGTNRFVPARDARKPSYAPCYRGNVRAQLTLLRCRGEAI
ncbi:hypothetical protein V6S67_09335 [Arthrobacter sp. Soc17.1.1.1]|uniref:hypothetical protein n=1 Tax=Arthrobacter sp. Soc17.1.1.1 TaxID=3121277 RepID=UPI002FE492B4